MAGAGLRIRLEFSPDLVTKQMANAGLQRAWYEPLRAKAGTVAELAAELLQRFSLLVPGGSSGLVLRCGGFTLPARQRLTLLRDNDVVYVSQAPPLSLRQGTNRHQNLDGSVRPEDEEEEDGEDSPRPCLVCQDKSQADVQVPLSRMREHIGGHILVGDIPPSACGFCGQVGTCSTTLEKSRSTIWPASNCEYYHKFNVKALLKSDCKLPRCTNAPVLCGACQQPNAFVWKYGMAAHWHSSHPQQLDQFPAEFQVGSPEAEVVKRRLLKRKRPEPSADLPPFLARRWSATASSGGAAGGSGGGIAPRAAAPPHGAATHAALGHHSQSAPRLALPVGVVMSGPAPPAMLPDMPGDTQFDWHLHPTATPAWLGRPNALPMLSFGLASPGLSSQQMVEAYMQQTQVSQILESSISEPPPKVSVKCESGGPDVRSCGTIGGTFGGAFDGGKDGGRAVQSRHEGNASDGASSIDLMLQSQSLGRTAASSEYPIREFAGVGEEVEQPEEGRDSAGHSMPLSRSNERGDQAAPSVPATRVRPTLSVLPPVQYGMSPPLQYGLSPPGQYGMSPSGQYGLSPRYAESPASSQQPHALSHQLSQQLSPPPLSTQLQPQLQQQMSQQLQQQLQQQQQHQQHASQQLLHPQQAMLRQFTQQVGHPQQQQQQHASQQLQFQPLQQQPQQQQQQSHQTSLLLNHMVQQQQPQSSLLPQPFRRSVPFSPFAAMASSVVTTGNPTPSTPALSPRGLLH